MNLKNGGLNGRRHSNGQDTCFGPAIDLAGSHRGQALAGSILNLRMVREL